MLSEKKKNFKEMVHTVVDKTYIATPTFISIDINNGVVVESFKKLIDFTDKTVSISAADKNIYIYGEMLQITSFSKTTVYISGKVTKIEIFEVR